MNTGKYSAIHPEFEDEYGNVVLKSDKPVPTEGKARMWIIFPEMRKEVQRIGLMLEFSIFCGRSKESCDRRNY